ncbi:MAG TPA: VWA domain-containing protein [Candidatus Acidoferrales bacterium]|nr:VWA domain-containing protein [Candidatus Acidoferrales bacterium]
MIAHDHKGQVLIPVTLGFALLGVFVGLAIDLGRGYLTHSRLQRVVDAASIAAAFVLKGQTANEASAREAARDAARMNGFSCCDAGNDLVVNFVDKDVPGGPPMRFAQVTGTAEVPTTFMRLLSLLVGGSYDRLSVSAFAEAGPDRPVDLMLVLDRSGSMTKPDGSGRTKIEALKISVKAFLDNAFSADDRIGLVSFATRGCGSGGVDSTVSGACSADVPLDLASSSHIGTLKTAVDGLQAVGGTNTMEALQTARGPVAAAFADGARAASRKAVILVTDGQPTFMRRDSDSDCKENPRNGSTLPAPGGTGSFPSGCKHGVPSGSFNFVYRQPLTSGGTSNLERIPNPGTSAALYRDFIRCTRALQGCDTNGAMFEADRIRDLDGNSDGRGDVVVFAIAIGRPEPGDPQSSLDDNAKCLLARIANDPQTVRSCSSVFTTVDQDTHADLKEGIPWTSCATNPSSCIDPNQQQGRVFTVDVNGNVTQQLADIFREVAALLKLRITI